MKGNAMIHFAKCIVGIDKPHSQTTVAEQELLSKYAMGANIAVEIGVYEGVNTVLISSVLSDKGVLYGIDPFFKGSIGICYHERIARQSIRKKNLSHKVKMINKLSYDAVNDVPDFIDFIFIDGDHSYEGLKKDWEGWHPKIKQGGIIALHDTEIPSYDLDVGKLGSYKFFNDIIKEDVRFKQVAIVDSLNILEKLRH